MTEHGARCYGDQDTMKALQQSLMSIHYLKFLIRVRRDDALECSYEI